jgi:hypothetical protein
MKTFYVEMLFSKNGDVYEIIWGEMLEPRSSPAHALYVLNN